MVTRRKIAKQTPRAKTRVVIHILLYKGDKNVQKVPKNAIFYPKKVIFPKKNCDITGVFHFQNV